MHRNANAPVWERFSLMQHQQYARSFRVRNVAIAVRSALVQQLNITRIPLMLVVRFEKNRIRNPDEVRAIILSERPEAVHEEGWGGRNEQSRQRRDVVSDTGRGQARGADPLMTH